MNCLQDWNPVGFSKAKGFSAVIIGSRLQGKSHLIKHLYRTMLKTRFHQTIVFTNSKITGAFASLGIPDNYIFQEYDSSVIERVFQAYDVHKKKGKTLETLIIFDDCISLKQKADNMLQQVFTRGRHAGISIIFSTQETKMINTVMRNNLDYLFIFRQKRNECLEYLVNDFLSGIVDEEVLKGEKEKVWLTRLLKRTCIDHRLVIVDLRLEEDNWQKIIQTYKVPN